MADELVERATELLARLEEIDGNKAGAFTLRQHGAVGTIFEQKLAAALAVMPPVEPTPEMIEAGLAELEAGGNIPAGIVRAIYVAMIAQGRG